MLALSQLLILYTWFMLAVLLLFLLLIGRFYQRFSGERTFFRLFAVPILLFGVSAVRYSSIDQSAYDPFGDLTSALAGLFLLLLSLFLLHRMTAGRA